MRCELQQIGGFYPLFFTNLIINTYDMTHNIIVDYHDYDYYTLSVWYFNPLSDDNIGTNVDISVDKLNEYLITEGYIDANEMDLDGEPMTVFSFLSFKTCYDFNSVYKILADYIYLTFLQ